MKKLGTIFFLSLFAAGCFYFGLEPDGRQVNVEIGEKIVEVELS